MKGVNFQSLEEINNKEDEELLTLSLSTGPKSPISKPKDEIFPPDPSLFHQALFNNPTFMASPPQPPLSPQQNPIPQLPPYPPPCPPPRGRKLPRLNFNQGKSETVPAPYPWATTTRAGVYSLDYLLSNGLTAITGRVQCKKCEGNYEIEYDLQENFIKVASFISNNKFAMHDRAPNRWMNPSLPICKFCNDENVTVKPVLAKKRSINWLFLLLGEMLGCCTLAQLKFYCKHNKNHRTGAKDRVLYLTYLSLCKQLDPRGPFDP